MGDMKNTQFFKTVQDDTKLEVSQVLEQVYFALTEKGYNPINQIVGYIMSGDPTYITSHKSARSLIMKVERDEILEERVSVDGGDYMIGHTKQYVKAVVPYREGLKNVTVRGRFEKMVTDEILFLAEE